MKKTFITLCIGLVALILQIHTQAETKHFGESFGDTDLKFISRLYEDINEKKRFEIKAQYPEIENNNSPSAQKFNQTAKALVMDQVNEFRKGMMENTEEDLSYLPEGVNNYIEIGYSIEFSSDELVSVNFRRSEFTGGAHPNSWTFTVNYDLKNNRELNLSDLFKPNSKYLEFISAYSIESLKKQQGEDADEEWITTGAGAKAENFKSWSITKKGLMFTFDSYQVASYAAGDFTVVIPFEKFPDEIQSELFYPVKTVSYVDGSPANWCRGGRWTMLDTEFKLAKIKGRKNEKAYFYGDDNDCPNGVNCRKKAYLIAGDEVIIQRTYGNFACSWFQPKKGYGTVGWITLDKLEMQKNDNPNDGDWTGEWIYGESNIDIKAAESRGKYTVKGNAFWRGLGDNIHIGELDYEGMPEQDKMTVSDGEGQYACRVKMQRLGKYLIVSDNLMCGGVNVSFNGIYQRK